MNALSLWASKLAYVPVLFALAGALWSAYTDLRWGKIRNYVTWPLILLGWAWALAEWGLRGFVIVFASSIALGVLSTLTGRIGEGDIKLIMGISACLGFPGNLLFLAFFFMVLAVSMIFVRFRLHRFRPIETLKAIRNEALLELGGVKQANVLIHGKGIQHLGGPVILVALILALIRAGMGWSLLIR